MINDVYTDRRLVQCTHRFKMIISLGLCCSLWNVWKTTHSGWNDCLKKAMTFLWSLFIDLSAPHILSLCRWLHFIFLLFFSSFLQQRIKCAVYRMKCSIFVFFHQFNSFSFSTFGQVSERVCVDIRFRLQMHWQLLVSSIAISNTYMCVDVNCAMDRCVRMREYDQFRKGTVRTGCQRDRLYQLKWLHNVGRHVGIQNPTLYCSTATSRWSTCVHEWSLSLFLSLWEIRKHMGFINVYVYKYRFWTIATHTHIHKSLLKPHHSTCSALAHWYLCWNRLRVCASLVCCLRISFISFHFFFFTSLSRVCLPIFRSCNDGNQQVVSI